MLIELRAHSAETQSNKFFTYFLLITFDSETELITPK
jgi:hypothetical protein